ncbi:MAG: O-acetyl-ADP-ribose deacetylase [Flavobacteriales bacterium]|nr:O-acetyl-ADP-ribose deacetylase [Flavobacteriales bacterium]MBK9059058.1 O-acetyl-ADP-ribose deacetylase [Flavobacteriales bacterium]QQS73957.1 MAG: O-acetyl-ADP-ribose deacetylase [Flavobacteriales bacterium]
MNSRTKIEILKGDITKVTVDAIVNAANTSLLGGGGVDGAIHRAGGQAILDDCRKIIARQGGCKTGEAVITTAGNLNAKFVIHTVGPVWNGGQKNEKLKLADCYKNSLQIAVDNNCKTIAFPCISTGVYKYPTNEAARVSVDTVLDFVSSNPNKVEKVIFVCFDDDNFYFIKSQLNFKVYTVPSKLYADNEIIGTVNIGLEDDGMGVLSGQLIPTNKYDKYRDFFRKTFIEDQDDNLIRINKFTKDNKFKVVADDGTEFKEPIAGLIIYDFDKEPIQVELNGIDNDIWGKYYK